MPTLVFRTRGPVSLRAIMIGGWALLLVAALAISLFAVGSRTKSVRPSAIPSRSARRSCGCSARCRIVSLVMLFAYFFIKTTAQGWRGSTA